MAFVDADPIAEIVRCAYGFYDPKMRDEKKRKIYKYIMEPEVRKGYRVTCFNQSNDISFPCQACTDRSGL